jgi:hypothetical protein
VAIEQALEHEARVRRGDENASQLRSASEVRGGGESRQS